MTDKSNKSKVIRRTAIIFLTLLAIAAGTYFYVNHNAKASADDGYTETQAILMTIENNLESDGEITSALEEDVLPYTSYYLEEINVEEGDAVKEDGTILTYTNGYTMTAPYDCVIVGWNLPEEEEQLTSEHYISIAGTDVLQMEVSVSEEDISKISLGDTATVTVDAANESYEAEVSYISQMGSYSGGSSSFTARVTFDNDGSLKLGMSGSAAISLEKAENVIAVPVDAVSTNRGTSYVTTVVDGEQTQTEVETGISNGSYIEIKSGLEEGAVVLVKDSEDSSSGQSGMRDGMGGMPGGGSGGSGERPGGNGGNGERPGGSGNGGNRGNQNGNN